MLLRLRKILFYILFLAYIIGTPWIIFSSFGYGVNPAEGEIYKTGLLSIVTEPKGATVFVEDKKFSRKTPAVIGGLLSGEYHVRLSRKGFEPWQKTLQIIAGKATRLEPIVLLSKNPEEETLFKETFQDLLPKGNDFKLFVLQGSALKDLFKIDLFFKRKTALRRSIKEVEPIQNLNEQPEQNSYTVLMKVQEPRRVGTVLYDLEHEKIAADLTPWVPGNVEDIEWDSQNPGYVYTLKKGQVTGIDLEQKKIYPIGIGDILGLESRQRKIYFLKKDFSFWQANPRGENAVPLLEKEAESRAFLHGKGNFYRIELLKRELFQKELFIFLSDRGELMSNWPPYRLAEGVKGFVHSLKGNTEKILFWTDHEISVFDFAMKSPEEEALPPRVLLYRSGEQIQQAFWSYENTHVIFLDENQVFLMEAGEAAPYLIRTLTPVAKGSHIFYNDHHRSLYYLEPENRWLTRLKVSD